jgi:hypothetical protein
LTPFRLVALASLAALGVQGRPSLAADAAATPIYEADVYLGFDARQNDYIVHWLDRFGAAGARVVGTGKREGSVLTVIIPYKESDFRDTFDWREKSGTWLPTIENQNKDGTWSVFAHYSMVPEPAVRH